MKRLLLVALLTLSACSHPHLDTPQFVFPAAPSKLMEPLPPLDTIQPPKASKS